MNIYKTLFGSFQNQNIDDILKSNEMASVASNFSYISFPSSKDAKWKESNPEKT